MEIKRLDSIELEMQQILGDLYAQSSLIDEMEHDLRETFAELREERIQNGEI